MVTARDVTKMRLLTVAGMRQCMLPSSCPTDDVGSWNRKYPFRICVNFLTCMRWNEHSMYCVFWTRWKSSVAVTNG